MLLGEARQTSGKRPEITDEINQPLPGVSIIDVANIIR